MKNNNKGYKLLQVLLLILILITLTACGKKKIDVSETLTVSFDGYNGYGTAELKDEYAWESEAFEAEGYDDITDSFSLEYAFVLESAVSYEVSPKENLSNGDEVTVSVIIDEDKLKDYKINLVAEEKRFIVDGLEEIQQLDLFENVDVVFSGAAPYATASVSDVNEDSYVIIQYMLDKKENLAIGDTVTVTASYDKDKLMKAGYVAESDTKEFEVSNIPHYISKLEELPEEANAALKKQTEDIIQANIAKSSTYSLSDFEFMGNYFLNQKPGISTGDKKNTIYYVYKINLTGKKEITYYSYVGYHDVLITEDNICVYDFKNSITPWNQFFVGLSNFDGYSSLDELFNECVTKKLETYQYETTVEE